ncbi:MAG: Trm112 family protein [Nocardioides sp.]
MQLDPRLRQIIVCPQCHGGLTDQTSESTTTEPRIELGCARCSLAYPVVDGIPVLLVDEARPVG